MRPLVPLLLVFLLAPIAAAAPSSGKTHILFDTYGAFWAPVAGGPVTQLLDRQVRTDAAFDGERFLVTWYGADGVRFGVFAEGALTPLVETLLDDSFDAIHGPVVEWDGSRYLVFWASRGAAHAATITAQGAIVRRFNLDLPWIDAAAANGATIAVTHVATSIETRTSSLDVILLDDEFQTLHQTRTASIPLLGAIGSSVIEPFGAGYYVAWMQSPQFRYQEIAGTRIAPDGTALDIVESTAGTRRISGQLLDTSVGTPYGPNIFGVELIAYRSRIVAVMKRSWGVGVTAAAIDAAGVIEGPVPVGGKFLMPENAVTIFREDGSPALAWIEDMLDPNPFVEIQPFHALVSAPRRRGARH
jgi:hypothetical protein